ncbi:hypothetical protein A9Q80_04200 [Cycloclasticus sp. 46_83_sub15_T18]|nr:hypothetical protein A9Q80_04200 [Cycloclasticus sp. 46_83_sub15_T18]
MSKKTEYYVNLMLDQKRLIKSSQSIIRKKRSPLARNIAKGNVKAIMQAATDRVHGSLNRNQREKICKILCEAKHQSSKIIKHDAARDLLSWVLNGVIGLIDTATGLVTSLMWVVIKQLKDVICMCKLSGDCFNGACSETA